MSTVPVDVNNLVEITLADGVKRHLRFSLGARKRICERFGNEPLDILKAPPQDLLPMVLLEGLVEREGINENKILEELVAAPMVDDVTLKFIESFFVAKVAQNLKRVLAAVNSNSEQALRELETKATGQPAIQEPANPTTLQ